MFCCNWDITKFSTQWVEAMCCNRKREFENWSPCQKDSSWLDIGPLRQWNRRAIYLVIWACHMPSQKLRRTTLKSMISCNLLEITNRTKTIHASTHRSKHFYVLVYLCMLHVVYNILSRLCGNNWREKAGCLRSWFPWLHQASNRTITKTIIDQYWILGTHMQWPV